MNVRSPESGLTPWDTRIAPLTPRGTGKSARIITERRAVWATQDAGPRTLDPKKKACSA